jgi:hypothetical protein
VRLLRRLLDVRGGGQAGADVEDLADAGAHDVPDGAPQKGTVGPHRRPRLGPPGGEGVAGLAVDLYLNFLARAASC